ncbi:MAG: hypothetical protein M3Z28_10005, partial [Candidatus Dormibacteraeota bacterium]|nr:hypothetical protein [Candidatus Dormibacteraeota bacterium]
IQNVQRMVQQGYISHTNGVELDLACGSGASRSSGENVGYISSGIDDVHMNDLYMNSPGHRANILGQFQYVATAWAIAPNGYAYNAEEFLSASAPLVPGGFVPLPPTRILDTRVGNGAPIGAVGPGGTLTVQVSGRGGIPATIVSAVVLNVTVTNTTVNGGYLIVYPTEDPRPLASNLNWMRGQTVPNLLEVGLGYSGQLNVFNGTGSADVIFDVAGYVPAITGTPARDGLYNPVVPSRLLDTRTGNGGALAPLGPGAFLNLQVTGRGGVPATGVSAVALNVTVTNPTSDSYLTIYPAGTALPLASNLNFPAGATVPNRVVVKLGVGGQISIFNGYGATNVVVDVNGWFTDGSNPSATGGTFTGVTPVRILDTRVGTGGFRAPLGAGQSLALQVAGFGGVPTMTDQVVATAVVVNVTVTDTTSGSYLTIYPSGAALPLASDLNWPAGATVPNLALVKLGADGKIVIYNGYGSVDVIVDVVGWYN